MERALGSFVYTRSTTRYLSPFWGVADVKQAYCPERLGRLYIVNAPWVFPFFWKLVQNCLDQNTASKIVVLGSNYKKELLQYIDADQLPVEYGGTCNCKGGCVPTHDISALRGKGPVARELESADAVTKTVGRHDVWETTLECNEAGGLFSWAVKVQSKDIRFSAEVRMATAKGFSEPRAISEPTRGDEHMGTFAVKGAARVTLRFDNRYSRFTSKTLKYVARVSELSPESAVEATDAEAFEELAAASALQVNDDDAADLAVSAKS